MDHNNTQRVARQLKSNSPLHAACGNTSVCRRERENGERSQERAAGGGRGERGSPPAVGGAELGGV